MSAGSRLGLASFVAAVAAALSACNSTAPTAATTDVTTSGNYRVAVGQQLSITLRTIGPDAFDSLPAISTPTVAFLGMSFAQPYNPGGPNQRFQFQAERAGLTLISFRRQDSDATVIDTVMTY